MPQPTPTPTASPTPEPGLFPFPAVPVLGDAVPRIRDALTGAVTGPRQRTTLVIVLGITLVAAAGLFAYLLLRRRVRRDE